MSSNKPQIENLQTELLSTELAPIPKNPMPAKNSSKNKSIEYLVVKSNELLDAQYPLSANQQKLLNACISMINPTADYRGPGLPPIKMTANQIARMTGTSVNSVYQFVKKAAYDFAKIPIVKIHADSPDPEKPNWSVINIAKRSSWENGVFTFEFHDDIAEHLYNLQQYTSYALVRQIRLKSKYAIRLFELTQRYLRPKETKPIYKNLDLEYVENFLAVSHIDPMNGKRTTKSSVSEFVHFRRRVLEPAIAEVEEFTDTKVEFEPRYETVNGKNRVVGLKFKFQNVSPEAQAEERTNKAKAVLEDWIDDKSDIEFIVRSYSDIQIFTNLEYLKDVLASGMTLKNKIGFFKHLLKYDIASLPDVANPYSRLYQRGSSEFEFVFRHIMCNWFSFPTEWQTSLQRYGLKSPFVIDEFELFREHCGGNDTIYPNFTSKHPPGTDEYTEDLRRWAASPENTDW